MGKNLPQRGPNVLLAKVTSYTVFHMAESHSCDRPSDMLDS